MQLRINIYEESCRDTLFVKSPSHVFFLITTLEIAYYIRLYMPLFVLSMS
jgi:hypothetical protein